MKARKIVRNRRKMDEKGVSPVVGVILMVAATIIIAAVVMGMLGGFKPATPPKNVGVSANRIDENRVDFTITSIQPPGTKIIAMAFRNGTGLINVSYTGVTSGIPVGNVTTVYTESAPEHIIINATFDDGTTQVIFDSKV